MCSMSLQSIGYQISPSNPTWFSLPFITIPKMSIVDIYKSHKDCTVFKLRNGNCYVNNKCIKAIYNTLYYNNEFIFQQHIFYADPSHPNIHFSYQMNIYGWMFQDKFEYLFGCIFKNCTIFPRMTYDQFLHELCNHRHIDRVPGLIRDLHGSTDVESDSYYEWTNEMLAFFDIEIRHADPDSKPLEHWTDETSFKSYPVKLG